MNIEKHPLNNNWLLWYHDSKDTSWDKSSYKDILEITTIEEFIILMNSWTLCLPDISEGMFFMMRRISETEIIFPLWEDKWNSNGGYWSFRINKEDALNVWRGISSLLIGETLTKDIKNMSYINGISISPKKNYCIIRVWNNNGNISDINIFSDELSKFVNISEVIYSLNQANIEKDNYKTQKKTYYETQNKYKQNDYYQRNSNRGRQRY
jgi:hypothetical protein